MSTNAKLSNEIDDLKMKLYDSESNMIKTKVECEDMMKRYDFLQKDFDKVKSDLQNEIQKNEDLKKDLWHNIDLRKKSE